MWDKSTDESLASLLANRVLDKLSSIANSFLKPPSSFLLAHSCSLPLLLDSAQFCPPCLLFSTKMSLAKYCEEEAALSTIVDNPHLEWDYSSLAMSVHLSQEWIDKIPQLSDKWQIISHNISPWVQSEEFLKKNREHLNWSVLSRKMINSEVVEKTQDLPWDVMQLMINDSIPPATFDKVVETKMLELSPNDTERIWKMTILRDHGYCPSIVGLDLIDLKFGHLCASSHLDLNLVHASQPWNFRRLTHHSKVNLQWILFWFPSKLIHDSSRDDCFDMEYLSEHTPIKDIFENKDLPWCWTTVCRTHAINARLILSRPDIPWDYKAFNENKQFCIGHALFYKEPVWKWDVAQLAKNHTGFRCSGCRVAY